MVLVTPVAICDLVARTVVDVYGVSPRATIPNGVPVQAFTLPARCRAEWREAHGIPEDAIVFVSVASLSPPKDPVCVVDAFAASRDRGDSVLLLVGDGALRGAVEARARCQGLEVRTGSLADSDMGSAGGGATGTDSASGAMAACYAASRLNTSRRSMSLQPEHCKVWCS